MSEKSQLWKDIDRIVLQASNHMAALRHVGIMPGRAGNGGTNAN